MASFSKASQGFLRALKPWLGLPDSLLGHHEDDSDEDDGSIWRLPSQETTLVGSQASAGSNSTVLKQYRSATDTDSRGWSRSLRSLAAHFYAEENTKPSGPSYDAVPKTPEKRVRLSPRKPLPWNRSSIRSRGANPGKISANGTSVFDNGDPSSITISPSSAPVLNVDIPKFNLAVDTQNQSMLADESLLRAYRSNRNQQSSEQLTQGAENHLGRRLRTQESEQVMGKIGWKFPVAGDPNDAYHELLQGPQSSWSETNVATKASSSNDSDVEDNDEDEEYHGAGILEFHAATKSKTSPRLDSQTEKPSSDHLNGESIERTIPLSHYLKTPSPPSKTRSMLRKSQSIRKNLNRLQQTFTGSLRGRPTLKPLRAPSYASDADAENSEERSSPPCPSMGSRHEWQSRRIERNRRYAEAVADRPPTEDDSESGEGSLQLSRSPTRNAIDPDRKSGSLIDVAHDSVGRPPSSSDTVTGDLRYAVEANERRSADELSVRNLRYAIEAIDRPSATELEDWEEGAAAIEPAHMIIPSPDSQDPYEAALQAAGLQPDRRHSWIPTLESLCECDDTTPAAAASCGGGGGNIASVAIRLDGVHVRGTSIHAGLLNAGIENQRQLYQGSAEELRVFNSVASSSDAGSEGEELGVGVGAVGYEQTGSMDDSQDKKKAGEKMQARCMIFIDSGMSAGGSDGGSSQDDIISID